MQNNKVIIKFFKNQWFIAGILFTIFLGLSFPEINKVLNPESITSIIIIIVLFFNTGLTIPTDSIIKDLVNFKLHLFVQFFIFIITPLSFYFCTMLFKGYLSNNMVVGFLALSVLPPTISSCIIFTHTCHGNTVAAMFNTSLSNIAGIVISPLLLSLLLQNSDFQGLGDGMSGILLKLFFIMFLPVMAGQVFHQFLKKRVLEYKSQISFFNNMLILIMSLFAFCRASESGNIFVELSIYPFVILAVMNLLLLLLAYYSAKFLKFSKQDLTAIIFTTPQKTIAMGIPLVSAVFADSPSVLAIAIIPLLFYYAWQLIVAAVVKSYLYSN